VSDPRDEGSAALAAQVADLRSIVTKWDARLQTLGLDGSLDLTAKLAELAELVSAGIEANTAPYWLEYSDAEYAAALAELADWVGQVLIPNYDTPGLKACWCNHPPAVWELSTLRAEWERIYNCKSPLLAAALTWLDRWLPGAMRRVAAVAKDCTTERCTRGALPERERN
jgi:hypothetical protein